MRILHWIEKHLLQSERDTGEQEEISRLKSDMIELKAQAQTLRAKNRALRTSLANVLQPGKFTG